MDPGQCWCPGQACHSSRLAALLALAVRLCDGGRWRSSPMDPPLSQQRPQADRFGLSQTEQALQVQDGCHPQTL